MIKQIYHGIQTSDGAGVNLTRIIGSPDLNMLDPFLLLDEFGSNNPDDYIGGFPPHPHRGFETITYMINGNFRHKDSAGNEGYLTDGGVQWMTAGKGVVHSEMPEQKEGLVRGFQLWLNLPKKKKMIDPSYNDIQAKDIPVVDIDGGIGTLFAFSSMGRREMPDAQIYIDGNVERLSKNGTFLGQHICTSLDGVALHINAFNFPIWGMLEKIAVNLMAGVPAVVKPSEYTSYLTEAMVKAIIDKRGPD